LGQQKKINHVVILVDPIYMKDLEFKRHWSMINEKHAQKTMLPKEWGNFKLLAIIIGDIVPSACPSTIVGVGTCNPL
jgi:hypothetical protein